MALISLPWTNLTQPSLGLAILKSHLDAEAVDARVFHLNLDLLEYLSAGTYDYLGQCWALNEFLFTAVLDPTPDRNQIESLRYQCEYYARDKPHPGYASADAMMALILDLRDRIIPAYLVKCAERILDYGPTLAGFTCMFDQTLASVALSRLLKDARPDIMTVLGGYAVQHEGGLEVLRAFPSIDCVARGESERTIIDLAWSSVGAGSIDDIAGVATRATMHDQSRIAARKWNIADSITPVFEDWFRDVDAIERGHDVTIDRRNLPIESSRGCWWGQKHHCTFCGIDEETLKYRSKAPEQVLAEINQLRAAHGADVSFRFADYIWPRQYYDDLLVRFAAYDPPLCLEAEIKANQTRDSVRKLASAGFRAVQPGIESFSSPVLRKMDKGVTAIQNVQLLKWGYVEGIEVHYNLLLAFPDDEVDDYLPVIALMPNLYHLTPPISHGGVVVTRFAPLQTDPARFGAAVEAVPNRCYDVMFSGAFLARTAFNMSKYSYYFERYFENDLRLREIYGQVILQSQHWKKMHRDGEVYLAYEARDGLLYFEDTRFGPAETFSLSSEATRIYELCDEAAISLKSLPDRLGVFDQEGRRQFDLAVEELEHRRLVWIGDGRIFGLGVPAEIVGSHIERGWKQEWIALSLE